MGLSVNNDQKDFVLLGNTNSSLWTNPYISDGSPLPVYPPCLYVGIYISFSFDNWL